MRLRSQRAASGQRRSEKSACDERRMPNTAKPYRGGDKTGERRDARLPFPRRPGAPSGSRRNEHRSPSSPRRVRLVVARPDRERSLGTARFRADVPLKVDKRWSRLAQRLSRHVIGVVKSLGSGGGVEQRAGCGLGGVREANALYVRPRGDEYYTMS